MVEAWSIEILLQDSAGQSRSLSFHQPVVSVGRAAGNDLIVSDPRVSSLHGRLVCSGPQVRFEDLGSTNGSVLVRGGQKTLLPRTGQGVELRQGDLLLLGDAQQPTSIRIERLEPAHALSPGQATVLASLPLSSAQLPPARLLGRLLELLPRLRIESDVASATHQVLEFLLEALPGAVRAECFLKEDDGHFQPTAVLGKEAGGVEGFVSSRQLLEKVAGERRVMLVQDTQTMAEASRSLMRLPLRSLLLAPLVVEERTTGVIQVAACQGGTFSEEHLQLMATLAGQLSSVMAGAKLLERLRRAEARLRGERDYLRQQRHGPLAVEQMLGDSPAMQKLRDQIRAVASSQAAVLIVGETGSGKELAARAIHESSPRATEAFVAINCSAIPAGLLESELFGHARGAFTGAVRERRGLFEVADGGTLFLDEIGEMPLELQPKLLRCLEQKEITPLGAGRPRRVDVRLIAASNRPLAELASAGRFRADLYYRLAGFTLKVPPLRERTSDILPLAEHFLREFEQRERRSHPGFSAQAALALQAFDWPGNVRQLRNEVERAALLAPNGQEIRREHLSPELGGEKEALEMEGTLNEIMERLERSVIRTALRRHGGNRTRCAEALGISRQALIAKIARLGLEEEK